METTHKPGSLEATVATLRLLEASDTRVRIGFTIGTGSDHPVDIYSASDAILFVTAMANTAEFMGQSVSFILTREEDA